MRKLLREIVFFNHVSDEIFDIIEKSDYLIKEYDSNEIIYQIGDKIEYINIILKGALKTNEFMINGREIVSSYYFENDAFPFYMIYGGVDTYPYNVYCYKKARVCHIKVETMKLCVEKDQVFMKNILEFVSRYTCYNKLVIRSTQYNYVNKRLAYWLLNSNTNSNENHVKIPATQAVLADILHVNRSSINQELKKLEKEKVIKIKNKKIYIVNREYLENLMDL